ncbi:MULTISPECIES: DUF6279 family lipoprotein [Marinomonas]|uniref:DUF6279 family lipoprotein n=1 Tax=Marinomonas rhodophyticola TaxID=2992803 RepID=A0ABT3KAX5_9GAMM|nr:DUF6279 family lipoprotein [Marinomonas sp. KJ51-3]MCW4627684.1 DUF6279 family lipoprotein [Marinomonas sp. KJ51-3]
MKKARLPLVIVLSFLLSACSSSFVYNNIDWLLYWYLGDYVDLSLDQKAVLDERVVAWQSWHRSTELEKYQAQLKRLRVKFASGALSEEQWLSEFEEAQQHLHRFRSKIAPELAGIAQQLSVAQVEGALSAWSKKRHERQSEFEKRTEAERLIRQEERLTEFVEDNVGELTKLQSSIINTYAPRFLSTNNERTAYHTSLQNVIRDIFANRDTFEFEQQLADLIRHPDQYKTPQYQAILDRNARLYAQMLAELSSTFTQKQKLTLDDKLEEKINLIGDLISD